MRPIRFLAILFAAGCGPYWIEAKPSAGPDDPTGPTFASDPSYVGARIDASGVVTCGDPGARLREGPFTRRSADVPPASRAFLWSAGAMAGDLDGDGLVDIVTPLEDGARLYRQRGDISFARHDDRLDPFDLSYGTGGSLADIDGDADLDVLILRYDRPAVVLRNDGTGAFEDVSLVTGIDISGPATASTWGDVDQDGDLDLFVGSYGYVDGEATPGSGYLFENHGGVFVDRSSSLPEALRRGYTRIGGFHDLDGDAFPELYVVNDLGSVQPNVLLRNVGGLLVPDGGASGLDLEMAGGGLGVGDVNEDGVPDFLIPQWNDLSLMLSSPDGRWSDWAATLGMTPRDDRSVGWGAELADVDNDGDLDGIVTYGRFDVDGWETSSGDEPDALFLQQDDGTFVDVAAEWGLEDPDTGRGVVVADVNGDGWLDVLKRELEGQSPLYLSRCGEAHWLEVTLRDDAVANRFAVGGSVRVVTADGRSRVRAVSAGGTGYGTGGPPVLHFGLGDADLVDRIEVSWPDGERSVLAFNLEADQKLTITRD